MCQDAVAFGIWDPCVCGLAHISVTQDACVKDSDLLSVVSKFLSKKGGQGAYRNMADRVFGESTGECQ